MATQKKLLGKKKKVIDSNSFAQVPRSMTDASEYDPEYARQAIGLVNMGDIETGDSNKDLVRVVLGKYWDLSPVRNHLYTATPPEPEGSVEVFEIGWPALKVFHKSPIEIEYCTPKEQYKTINPTTHTTVEKISLYCNIPPNSNLGKDTPGDNGYLAWVAAMKTGVTNDAGQFFPPIVKANVDFYDHYHEANKPFTPKEMLQKQFDGNGKIYIANYKTYYNERIRSGEYERATGKRTSVNNALPSVYGFLRVIAGPENLSRENVTRYDGIVEEIKPYYKETPEISFDNITKGGNILHDYPFESLISLYGSIGTENYDIAKTTKEEKESRIIHRLVNAPYDSTTVFNPYKPRRRASGIDLDGLFESYFDEYTYRITQDPKMNKKIIYNKNIQMLEKVMSNIFFDASVIPIMNKIDKYKNYFPFYNEIEFSTERNTTIGDFAKDYNLIDILAYHFASSASKERIQTTLPFHLFTDKAQEKKYSTEPTIETTQADGTVMVISEQEAWNFANAATELSAGARSPDANTKKYDLAKPLSFVDLNEDPVTQTLEEGSQIESIARYPIQNTKMTFDFVKMLNDFLETEDYFDDFASNTYDIRNFAARLDGIARDGGSWMTKIAKIVGGDLDNVFNKNINGPTLREKIFEIYDLVKRDYRDILDGKPAHSEDIFYRIEKVLIKNDGSETTIQNMFFPNTTELDLIKYVDTQIKYRTYAKYKYRIYAYRLVFGSQYRYQWTLPEYKDSQTAQTALGGSISADDHYAATGGPKLDQNSTIGEHLVLLTAGAMAPSTMQGPFPPLQLSSDENFDLNLGLSDPMGTLVPFYNEDPNNTTTVKDLGLGASNAQGTDTDFFYKNYTADFRVRLRPSIKVVADKIFETPVMMVMDKPPVPPHVDIIPYRAVNNKIKIMLDGLVDRYRKAPIQILDSDKEEFQLALDAQLSPDGKIEFGSDDPIASFQIFRTEKHPAKYKDFEWYQTVNGSVFEETILPNKKYWYVFRAVDSHNHISNPTAIYQVELVDMKGAVKPVIKTVPLMMPEIADNRLEIQKYLYITPTMKQLHFSDDPATDSIFSSDDVKKRYKIRLTSKSSGKKIDFNLYFQKKEQVSMQGALMGLFAEKDKKDIYVQGAGYNLLDSETP